MDAEAISTGEEARDALIRQVTSPCAGSIPPRNDRSRRHVFVEVAPAKFCGLLRQIDRWVRALNVEDAASLNATMEKIAQDRA